MIADFYKQSDIFITGGSGVVGKAAIEKILRSCDVKNIFILLRPKRGQTPETRLEEVKNSRIFNVLKEQKPNELDKLVVIPGDITVEGLGISSENKLLLQNVSIFINSAATTRFDEPIRRAIEINVKSTLVALKLAETLSNLKIFLHVSTFFCNPFVNFLETKMYPAVFDWRIALKTLDLPEEVDSNLAAVTDKLTAGFPNTYVFTKHLAEQLVNDYRTKLPVAIFRPSIVVGALQEPEPGFTETMTGVMGLFVVWGTGFIQVLLCSKKSVLDFTPLDMTTKLMIMFIANTGQLKKKTFDEKIPILMSSSKNLLFNTFGEIGTMISKLVKEHPYEKSFWIPHITQTGCAFVFYIYFFLLQLLPAFIFDALMMLFRRKPMFMKLQRRLLINSQALRFFISTEFNSEGTKDFQEYVKIGKGTDFDLTELAACCLTNEGMINVLTVIIRGCRKFLLNEDESTLSQCRTKLKIKLLLYSILRIAVMFAVGCYIYRRVINYFIES
ncbi:fatty acyl-CoA reductase wat-like [Episyrphus balteatus]|uniref:fatty acyl-CoA reductase wat-like n=1 Tax=Episyrphus balteatus TaxID=286459 RepID=UPI00248573B2|nr:fatty acyl-CoA reductase wat-like [Episyrphus balteatus]